MARRWVSLTFWLATAASVHIIPSEDSRSFIKAAFESNDNNITVFVGRAAELPACDAEQASFLFKPASSHASLVQGTHLSLTRPWLQLFSAS